MAVPGPVTVAGVVQGCDQQLLYVQLLSCFAATSRCLLNLNGIYIGQ